VIIASLPPTPDFARSDWVDQRIPKNIVAANTSTNTNQRTPCTGKPAGNAFFGIPESADRPQLNCETLPLSTASILDYASDIADTLPENPPDGAACNGRRYCKEITCDEHVGAVSAAVISQTAPHHANPFIMIKYSGSDAPDLKWLQFAWVEILVRKKPEDSLEPWTNDGSPIYTTNGPLKLSANSAQPNYRVDSMNPFSPYYGGPDHVAFPDLPPFRFARLRGARARDRTSEIIADLPGTGIRLVPNDPPIYEVRQIDHFNDFLVSDTGKVCANISWTATFVSSRGATASASNPATHPVFEIQDVDDKSTLNSAQLQQLRNQYPHYRSDLLH
jgi:hypothetical protein